MSSPASRMPSRRMTVDQYLALERQGSVRYEYLAGEVFAMSGTSARHNTVVTRLLSAVSAHLRSSTWVAHSTHVKVGIRTHMRDYVYYPDLVVISASEQTQVPFLRNPVLVGEVISPSTENIDRREKALMYREIATLEEYVLVAVDCCEVTVFRRSQQWRPEICGSPALVAELRSIGLKLPLSQVYPDGN